MRISDAIRTLLLLRKPMRQSELTAEMILDFASNDQQENAEKIPAPPLSNKEDEKV
jgi:hypothetical protein